MYIEDKLLRQLQASRSKPLELLIALYLEADEDGVITTSRSKLMAMTGMTDQTVRTSLKILCDSLVTNQASNQQLTKITIRNIASYKQVPLVSNQASNQLKDKETEKENIPSSSSPTTLLTLSIKEKDKEKESLSINKAPVRKIFVPPTIEEVRSYIAEKGWDIDAESWWNFYNAKNWMIGKNKMVKWKSAVATWKKRTNNSNSNGRNSYSEQRRERDEWFTEQSRQAFLQTLTGSTEDNLPFQ